MATWGSRGVQRSSQTLGEQEPNSNLIQIRNGRLILRKTPTPWRPEPSAQAAAEKVLKGKLTYIPIGDEKFWKETQAIVAKAQRK